MNNCPACGWQLEPKRVVSQIGNLTISLSGDTFWNDHRVPLTAGETAVLYFIACNPGVWIKPDAILNAMSRTENTNNVSVLVHRIRAKLTAVDPTFDRLVSEKGQGARGYRWLTDGERLA